MADDWRASVPERLRAFPDMVTIADVAEMLGFDPAYVRKLRVQRTRLDAQGSTEPAINALPAALPVSRRPLYWSAPVMIEWAMQTGRINPVTGKPQRLHASKGMDTLDTLD